MLHLLAGFTVSGLFLTRNQRLPPGAGISGTEEQMQEVFWGAEGLSLL